MVFHWYRFCQASLHNGFNVSLTLSRNACSLSILALHTNLVVGFWSGTAPKEEQPQCSPH